MVEELDLRINEYLQEKFSLSVSKSSYFLHSNWQEFCLSIGQDHSIDSFYLPRSFQAHLNQDSEFLTLNFLHEFFGHGLFAENHSKGRELHDLEQILYEEEKKNFQDKQIPIKELKSFREDNPVYKNIVQSYDENLNLQEGFAMWLEWLLAKEFLSEDAFWEKQEVYLRRFGKEYQNNISLVKEFISYSKTLTPHALLFDLGLPKHYDKNVLLEILNKIYGKKFDDLQLVLLYGSQKPESDIDLFIVDQESYNFFNGWLDVYAVKEDEIEMVIKNLDVGVTDALFTGELIHGSKDYLTNLKNRALSVPITEKAVYYNLSKSKEQKEYHEKLDDERQKKIALSYSLSYRRNALELKKGNKPLTLKKLKELYDFEKLEERTSY